MQYLLKNNNIIQNEKHPFHLVDPSPWPLLTALSAFKVTLGFVKWFQPFQYGLLSLFLSLLTLVLFMSYWFSDMVSESTFEGHHTIKVQLGLSMGMVLFILSEIMFFFAFFWSFFHFSLSPSIWIGCQWPPQGIEVFNAWHLPLLNTLILLCSGVTVTCAHHAIVGAKRKQAIMYLFFTMFLGVIFTYFQAVEYTHAGFSMCDSVYGSMFFLATGFHGFHGVSSNLNMYLMKNYPTLSYI